MKNADVFKEYGSERVIMEQQLCFFAQDLQEKLGIQFPFNLVTEIKKFMSDESYVDVGFAENVKMDSLKKDMIDVEVVDVD